MSKYREELLLAAKDMGAAGTETFDIKTKNLISRIEIIFKTTKASQGMSAGSPANIPKIELVDGAKPLHSLTGYTNQALAYYSRPGRVLDHGQHINALSEVDVYPLDFGRFLWDPRLAFDPKRYSNPQLKVTWDEDVSDTSVSVNSMEIWMHLFDEKVIAPIGFLSAREHWSSALGADGTNHEIDLPDDEVIRQILLRAYYAGYEPWYQVDAAKLKEMTDGKEIFDFTDLEMYYRRMKSHWPPIVQQVAVFADATGRVFYFPPTDYWMSGTFMGQGATAELYESNQSSKGGKMTLMSSGSPNITGLVHGYLPWHCFQFPMGDQGDPDDWYDPAGKAPMLTITSDEAGTNGVGTVVLETVKKY